MRMNPDDRKLLILEAASKVARDVGYLQLTRDQAATAAGVAHGLINHHFGTIDGLRRAILELAIENQDLELVAQGVISKHPVIKNAPYDVKLKAFRHYLESRG